jgi:transcription-repair coupling factor (superfamily II helicase)
LRLSELIRAYPTGTVLLAHGPCFNESEPHMDLRPLLQSLQAVEPLTEVYARLDSGATVTLGAVDASKAAVAALLWRRMRRPVLLVAARESDAETYHEQLRAWAGEAAVRFPARSGLPYQRDAGGTEASWQRIAVLRRMASAGRDEPPLVVASVAAVAEHTLRPAELGRGPGLVEAGQRLSLEALAEALVEAGYAMERLVERPGQAARRGGLIDVFPPGLDDPVRIEFFGQDVESIRSFSIETQRTIERLDRVHIGPATEWFPTREELASLAEELEGARGEQAEEDVHALRRGELPAPGLYGPLAVDATILDHLRPASVASETSRDALLVLDEREALNAAMRDLDELATERRADLAARGEIDARAPFPHEHHGLLTAALDDHRRRVELARWATGHEPGAFRLPFAPADAYAGRLQDAASETHRRQQRGDRVVVATQQAQRFAEVLAEAGVEAPVRRALDGVPPRGAVTLVQGGLPEGWEVATPDGILALVTDRELFGFVKRRRALRRRGTHRSRFLAEVQPGDFVVHADHGIARFAGIVRRPVDGEDRDYLELRYAGEDRLYVPIEQVDRVTRYTGPGGQAPGLTRLGSQEWTRARAKVREAVAIVAQDLLRLYAARQMLSGHGFSPDTPWQDEMEQGFPYEETQDQLEALTAVKADMESERPMDRIICGDVGFGKTEVAIRAAFKAVQDGYQVAVLVPTTVLAEQHLRTFRERLSAFPVSIDVLSRFRSDAEAREIIQRARAGDLDMLIGTHRLLDPSIEFKNLGLVIIDEEQRFGVTHKERLKRLRLEVDVLTLSATPIPRTMHMALSGIRDMSTIETAPEGRLSVQTYVSEWDDAMAREAILAEIERGGQVYIVHNRVKSIDEFADHISELVPEARVVVGHGQMPETVLQKVMERFADGEFDVLVCTTIIESGIDIPNVNTLIVDRADRLGLAQMYQLRGRVGRGTNQAFAYLFHPRDSVLTEEAQARLSTIFEASELGAGYQIALRDLEIRGAGNLLGAEQSGHIAAVGFDLYTEMLAEAVEAMKAAHEQREPERLPHESRDALRAVVIDLPAPAYIPESYVPEIEARLALYQRIAQLRSAEEAETLARETEDRLGALPEPLTNLLALVRIRLAALEAGLASVRLDGSEVVITSREERPFAARHLPSLPRGLRVGRTQVRLDRAALGGDWLSPVEALLRLLSGERVEMVA